MKLFNKAFVSACTATCLIFFQPYRAQAETWTIYIYIRGESVTLSPTTMNFDNLIECVMAVGEINIMKERAGDFYQEQKKITEQEVEEKLDSFADILEAEVNSGQLPADVTAYFTAYLNSVGRSQVLNRYNIIDNIHFRKMVPAFEAYGSAPIKEALKKYFDAEDRYEKMGGSGTNTSLYSEYNYKCIITGLD